MREIGGESFEGGWVGGFLCWGGGVSCNSILGNAINPCGVWSRVEGRGREGGGLFGVFL